MSKPDMKTDIRVMRYTAQLRKLREEHGLTYAQVGEIIGKSARTYKRIEAGESDLLVSGALKLSKFYQVTIDELLDFHLPSEK